MSRNCFFEIKVVLYAANNQHLSDCRMAKVKPLYDILNKKLRRFGVVHEDLSIDKSMVPYYGRHSCKQFIRGKPIRFEYKLWVLASSTDLPYHIEIYEGKSPNAEDISLGERVVKTALEIKSAITRLNIVFSSTIFSQVVNCSLTWMLKDSEPLVP